MSETGVIYAVICAVAQILSHTGMGFCLEQLLTEREERGPRRKRIAIWIVLGSVIFGGKCLLASSVVFVSVMSPIVMSLSYVLFLLYFYKDKWGIKLFHIAMVMVQNALADVIYQSVWGYQMGYGIGDIPFRNQTYAEGCVVVAAITIMLNIIYTVIVLRTRKKKRVKTSLVWIVIMLFFTLMLFAVLVMRDTANAVGEGAQSYFIFTCIFTIMEFATMMLFLSQTEKQEAQKEKREAQEKVQKLQRVMELEKAHYEQIEARREEMAKIRQDYNNVITSVIHLIETGKTDEAGNMIQDLTERISKTKEYPFCGVPIINAVLTEKQNVCKAEGFSLSVDLLIPGTVAAADLDLCMIFGNLMDNAIRSCREVREVKKECSIILNAGVVQDYLIIKCRNTSLENREKKIKGTGYGHKILADIAGKYDGDFQTAYEAGIFTAQISLRQQRGKQHE